MTYPKRAALVRFGRGLGAAVAAAAIGYAINATPVVLEGTTLAIFVPIVASALLALDKYVRANFGTDY